MVLLQRQRRATPRPSARRLAECVPALLSSSPWSEPMRLNPRLHVQCFLAVCEALGGDGGAKESAVGVAVQIPVAGGSTTGTLRSEERSTGAGSDVGRRARAIAAASARPERG